MHQSKLKSVSHHSRHRKTHWYTVHITCTKLSNVSFQMMLTMYMRPISLVILWEFEPIDYMLLQNYIKSVQTKLRFCLSLTYSLSLCLCLFSLTTYLHKSHQPKWLSVIETPRRVSDTMFRRRLTKPGRSELVDPFASTRDACSIPCHRVRLKKTHLHSNPQWIHNHFVSRQP